MIARNSSDQLDPHRAAFWKIAGSGATFQAGSSAVDSATIVATAVYHLTGSVYAVGAASTLLRFGWLVPQIVVGHLAQRSRRSMPFYAIGAFGRAACIGAIALLLAIADLMPAVWMGTGFFVLWATYSFVSGIVAVPYNDIVGRTIASTARSRLLAWRFLGGAVLALAVAAVADRLLNSIPILNAYAGIFAIGAGLMLVSSFCFVSVVEPPGREVFIARSAGFREFVIAGFSVLRTNPRFRLFLYAQWLGGATLMALPFYVVAAVGVGLDTTHVGILLGAQTVGALVSNALWGGIGDRVGKLALLQAVGVLRLLAPAGALTLVAFAADLPEPGLVVAFAALFVAVGALLNGVTIGYLGFLMEISPDNRRPAYSAYFNAFASPAALLPLAGAVVADLGSVEFVFVAAFVASAVQFGVYRKLGRWEPAGALP